MNNFYGMGGQPCGETMGVQFIARIGAGVNPDQMHAERVNGYDPLPVIDAFRRKKQILEEGRGPVLLDTITYRISGHSPSDASSYRSKEEIEHWQQADSIHAFRETAGQRRRSGEDALDSARESIESRGVRHVPAGHRSGASPRIAPDSELVGSVMFSNRGSRSSTTARPSFCRTSRRIPACSRSGARSAPPCRTASRCPR